MYSTSFRTRDCAFPFWIFPFDKHFIATLVPVTVCIASECDRQLVVLQVAVTHHEEVRTFDNTKSSLCDVADDFILPQLPPWFILGWWCRFWTSGLPVERLRGRKFVTG